MGFWLLLLNHSGLLLLEVRVMRIDYCCRSKRIAGWHWLLRLELRLSKWVGHTGGKWVALCLSLELGYHRLGLWLCKGGTRSEGILLLLRHLRLEWISSRWELLLLHLLLDLLLCLVFVIFHNHLQLPHHIVVCSLVKWIYTRVHLLATWQRVAGRNDLLLELRDGLCRLLWLGRSII